MASDYTELLKNLSAENIDPAIIAKLTESSGMTRDHLSGLMDYRSFSIKAQESSDALESAMLIFVSIDYLQELNLVSGWVVGDIAVCSVANFIKEPPPEGSYSAKVSGGTFTTLYTHEDIDEAKAWIKSVQEEISKIELPGLDILPDEHLTISAGIFPFSTEETSIDSALIEVKKRLKFAQSSGGNTVSIMSGDSIDIENKELELECYVKMVGSKAKHNVNVVQVSMHGLSFESPQPFMVRENIEIALRFDNEAVTLSGEIGWRRSSADGAEHPFNVGVKFNTISDSQQSVLESLMSRG